MFPFTVPNFLLNFWIHLEMLIIERVHWRPFLRHAKNPKATQNALLKRILWQNKDTRFGLEHRFEAVGSYEEFVRNVPVTRYEDLRPYIEVQERTHEPTLNSESPAMYAQTSGTTGEPKNIPLPESTLTQYRTGQALVAYAQYRGVPSLFQGRILTIVSPAQEGTLPSGTPYGSMSGLIQDAMPRSVRSKYVIPPDVFELEDYQWKYLLIAAFSLKTKNITFMASANPSTFLKLLEVVQNRLKELILLLASGSALHLEGVPEAVEALVRKGNLKNEMRAKELEGWMTRKEALGFADLWPNLKAVATWMGGNCSVLLPRLRSILPEDTRIIEMGYLSSEFRGTVPADVTENLCVPTLADNFFEFVTPEDWGSSDPCFLTLDQVEEGKNYYVLITAANGLYRYFINDIVRIEGNFHKTPCMQFVQKGRGITNLTGEKLYEQQILDAMHVIQLECGADLDFFILLADPERLEYSLYLDSPPLGFDLGGKLDAHLCTLNIEFKAKLLSGRLKPSQIVYLKSDIAEAYKAHCLSKGQRESQYKLVRLQYVKDCDFDFSPFEHASQ